MNDGHIVRVGVGRLSFDAGVVAIERAYLDTMRRLRERARLRRLRDPLTIRLFDSSGGLIARCGADGWTWGGDDRGEPGSITIEDSRGFAVRDVIMVDDLNTDLWGML